MSSKAFPVGDVDEWIHLDRTVEFDDGSKGGIDLENAYLDVTGDLDPFSVIVPPHITNREYEKQFRTSLQACGLPKIDIEILVAKYVYTMSHRQIEEDLGVSRQTVTNRLRKIHKHLKKTGFMNKAVRAQG